MKSCIFYTLLLPLLYVLIFFYGEYFLPYYMGPALFILPSLVCCIGWLWIQRRPILSIETPYICFILPLGFLLVACITSVYIWGYDGFSTIFSHFLVLAINAASSAAIIGLTWILRMLWRILSAPKQWK